MKIVLTGSLGHISKPLATTLVQTGHEVTVISSNPEKQKDIEALGATAAIGSMEDVHFLTIAFTGADVVYTMIAGGNYFNPEFDLMEYCRKIANNYVQAIKETGVRRVVHLSSIGAHLQKGSGLILSHRAAEDILATLSNVDIIFMRPVGFYYNLYVFMPAIKSHGVIAANYGADELLVWVSPIDIAAAITKEIETPASSKNATAGDRKVIYVASDELTGNETASVLGKAIGQPGLKWVLVPDEQRLSDLKAVGMNPKIAAALVEMFSAQHSGLLMEDYYLNKPTLGKVKIADFAKEFAAVYNKA